MKAREYFGNPLDLKSTPLKKTILPLILGSICFFSCKKEQFAQRLIQEACEFQTDNPAGRSYSSGSVVPITYTKKQCGMMPLSNKNYWVYQDSMFDNGNFLKVQYDTLRFNLNWKSLTDNLVWWEGTLQVGLPEKLYATDSTFFEMQERLFTPGMIDARKDFGLFEGDSLLYLTSFDDNAAQGRSVKLKSPVASPAGNFNDCILFEKNARNFRRDQVFFKPGFGVIRYTKELAPMGTRTIKLQQVSNLVAFHIE